MTPEDDALAQATRRRIFDHVAAHPGQHLRELQRRLGLAGGTLEYHLHVLVKEGMLVQRRDGRYTRYYAEGQVGRRDKDALALLRQQVPRQACAHLLERPDQSHGELLARFRLAPSTLTFHMKKLVAAGLVEARREGRATRYRVLEPDLVRRLLVEHRASFVDDVVDRFADVFLSVGAALEPSAGSAEGGSEGEDGAGEGPGAPPGGGGGGDAPGPRKREGTEDPGAGG